MSSRLGSRTLPVLVPAVLLLPSAAHAEKVVTQDPAGDVVRVTFVGPSDELFMEPAPDETATDIVRTVVAYGDTRLSVAIHVRDLPSSRGDAYVQIATSRATYDITVGKTAGSRAKASLRRKSGGDVECRGLRAGFDSQADVVAVSVPAACLESPRWVRVGVGTIGLQAPPTETDPEAIAVFADDGHRGGTIRNKGVDKGPRIHRG